MKYTFRPSASQTETTYSQELHPEQPGVLVVEPGEEVEFGDRLPPADGQWYDPDGNVVLPVAHKPEEPEADQPEDRPGTGADKQEQPEET